MKISVICCIYNSQPVVQKCLEPMIASMTGLPDVELILVDNHPPDNFPGAYALSLSVIHQGLVKVVDPGCNLGCHGGWNFGYKHSTGKYVCKLDDDTVIKTPDWPEKMCRALDNIPQLGFISSDIDAKQANKYERHTVNGIDLDVAREGIVGFSFVMFRREDIEAWGGEMKAGPYAAAGGVNIKDERLYGGEEVFCARAARKAGKFIAHLPGVFCHHLDNSERHPDYPMWKRAYGYHAWTDLDMESWIKNDLHISHYTRSLILESHCGKPNDVLMIEWIRRLAQIGPRDTGNLLWWIGKRTQNDVVKGVINEAMGRLSERFSYEA